MAVAKALIHGCSAGRGFVYIKPDGRVWPCPFLPLDCGNIRETQFYRIYRDSPVMAALRNRETLLKGRCGNCDFRSVCGGCRGRAFTASGDPLGEDPGLFHAGLRTARVPPGTVQGPAVSPDPPSSDRESKRRWPEIVEMTPYGDASPPLQRDDRRRRPR